MSFVFKPTWFSKSIALAIVMSFVTYYGNGREYHNLITWAIGDHAFATMIKVCLIIFAFILACVHMSSRKTD